jgi:predicted nucleic acid-binding protein
MSTAILAGGKAFMSGNLRFVDTNVLLYAHDDSAGEKHDQARALVERLWESREGCLSIQVLQEFFVNVTRKIAKPLGAETAKAVVADFSSWYLHVPGADDVLAAIGIHQRTGISFRDAMIVRSAGEIGCAVLCVLDREIADRYLGTAPSHATRLSGRSRTTGTRPPRGRGPPQPRQCSIVVVLTTTMLHRRGSAARPRKPDRDHLRRT